MKKMITIKTPTASFVVSDYNGDGSVWDEEKMRREYEERRKGVPIVAKLELV